MENSEFDKENKEKNTEEQVKQKELEKDTVLQHTNNKENEHESENFQKNEEQKEEENPISLETKMAGNRDHIIEEKDNKLVNTKVESNKNMDQVYEISKEEIDKMKTETKVEPTEHIENGFEEVKNKENIPEIKVEENIPESKVEEVKTEKEERMTTTSLDNKDFNNDNKSSELLTQRQLIETNIEKVNIELESEKDAKVNPENTTNERKIYESTNLPISTIEDQTGLESEANSNKPTAKTPSSNENLQKKQSTASEKFAEVPNSFSSERYVQSPGPCSKNAKSNENMKLIEKIDANKDKDPQLDEVRKSNLKTEENMLKKSGRGFCANCVIY